MNLSRLRGLIFFVLIYTLIVIGWGAWVRISHSGDGCGDSWPLCQGELIPNAETGKTWVEYSHRATSGIYGILIFAIFIWTRKFFPSGHRSRVFGVWLLIFTITEALLGAVLVKAGFVGGDQSFGRAMMMGVHQINSLLLTGTATLLLLTSAETSPRPPLRFHVPAWAQFIIFFAIAMTGAWAALATTLFPSTDWAESLRREFSPEAHPLLRVRSLHPFLAVIAGTTITVWLYRKADQVNGFLKQVYIQTAFVWAFGIIFGFLTLILMSPVWMKITHLMLAHLLWISLLRVYYLRDQITG